MRESGFLRAEQVMKEMQISRQKAYKIIRQLNEELAGMGFYERCRYHGGKENQQ